ncbi:hypothetical protein IMZ11_12790 [Microtetraspora sp. AC03309]|uniref:hypothetical protein n=1 Tax=Microtetraspora sp. AC03309 TaxID=2779376 RepID=UPI001E647CEA|nr:hypothetical protein [Microtetraspora sp. AC03309]MCC5576509.1 hypothetical protein [Microtetraspora sp. AC03309]
MTNTYDGLAINRSAVDSGLSQWATMAGDLEKALPGLIARIKELHATAPWGGGSEGRSFRDSYIQGGGPAALIDKGKAVVKEVVDMGPRLRTTFENTHAVEDAHERDLARGTVREV